MSSTRALKQLRAARELAIDQLFSIYTVSQSAKNNDDVHSRFKMCYRSLDGCYAEFERQHLGVINALSEDPDQLLVEKEVRADFLEKYYDIKTNYYELFEQQLDTKTVINSVQTKSAKLPEIKLPKFDGTLQNWPGFIDLFNSLVHNNTEISDVEKYKHLISSLEKAPLGIVRAVPLSSDNYAIAYKTLNDRFQNPRLLSDAYWSQIINAPKLTQESAEGIRNLIDTFEENLAALKVFKLPVDSWDFVIFKILIRKLSMETVKGFEMQEATNQIPSYQSLKVFLQKQCVALESVSLMLPKDSNFSKNSNLSKNSNSSRNSNFSKNSNYKPKQNNSNQHTFLVKTSKNSKSLSKSYICPICKEPHSIYKCPSFLSKTPNERLQMVVRNNWCTNCLHNGHKAHDCKSQDSCRVCGQGKHHTYLHVSSENSAETPPCNMVALPTSNKISTTLLSTAIVDILDAWGSYKPIRVFIDNGSQLNIIRQKCVTRLGLSKMPSSRSIFGVGQIETPSSGIVSCKIRPQNQNYPIFDFEALVMTKVCSKMPTSFIPKNTFQNIANLNLADPDFNIPAPIDLLLGGGIYPLILRDGRIVGDGVSPSCLNTCFGWILSGDLQPPTNPSSVSSSFIISESEINSTLKRFWEIENIPSIEVNSPEDTLCESIFQNTHSRDTSGRFQVFLPFKNGKPSFSNIYSIALRRFYSLERRLLKDKLLFDSYSESIKEFVDSGYMEEVPFSDRPSTYYLPHHCVVKPESTTTKVRVVFDASCKDAAGLSLNDTLLTGPKLQNDISTILLNFRLHPYTFTADVKKMYCQIMVASEHREYQRILWRFTPNDPIKSYALKVVTFGVSSSPYLALRTVMQLAEEGKDKFPLASKALVSDLYIDDIVSSIPNLHEAKQLQSELIALMQSGGFELRKWSANHPSLLENIPSEHRQQQSLIFNAEEISFIKILGLKWNPGCDSFSYTVESLDRPCTKRTILSSVARVFDPLGFLAPLTFFTKHLIQHLWSLGLDWDQVPPIDVLEKWEQYRAELPLISNLSITRPLCEETFLKCELHGFADSSEKGYAAVIYFRYLSKTGIKVTLVCAKSKVAPLKRLSLPRLELCAAVLLARLTSFILKTYSSKLHFSKVTAWSDSTTVLDWVKSSPHRWKTFVSNRVSYIQDKIPPSSWRHVRSEDNPADPGSRGLLPSQLLDCSLWWAGPIWLQQNVETWPHSISDHNSSQASDEERAISLLALTSSNYFDKLLQNFSSLSKMQTIIAHFLRFIHNFKYRNSPENQKSNHFSNFELYKALMVLVRYVQNSVFANDIQNLKECKPVSKPLRKLNPFLGEDGILRVGGRLLFSGLSYDKKHPALLPNKHRLTYLIIEDTHKKYLHPGPQTLQFLLAQKFWILCSRRAIRHCLSKCLTCFKINPTPLQPFMGNLPSFRINQVKPFSIVGVDYGGPFSIVFRKARGAKSMKAYICLFVCAVTKALHLELTSDLTTETFIAALRRLVARRGRCSQLFSDNGTAFVGAHRELNRLMEQAASTERIEWSFNPPSAPHFGGLFEAGIKSVKNYLIRTIGSQILSYEEFYTILCQVEAILNSRPLCPLSNDPNDLSVLTPGHFLTQEPLNTIPDPDLSDVSLNHLSRWQLVQRLTRDIWKRWHDSYLNTLQQRNKWLTSCHNVSRDTLVLIKNELVPPLEWKIGRIVELYPGHDGVARVAMVKTNTGLLKRPLVKLCPLPVVSTSDEM